MQLDVTVRLAELDKKVARPAAVSRLCLGLERLPAIGGGRKRLIIDDDKGAGVFRDITQVGNHNRNGFADKRDFVLGKNEWRNVVGKLAPRNCSGSRFCESSGGKSARVNTAWNPEAGAPPLPRCCGSQREHWGCARRRP